ncbi:MAG: choice-of-anchor L domain-containing protein [Pyrinomonadaceae bacterium]
MYTNLSARKLMSRGLVVSITALSVLASAVIWRTPAEMKDLGWSSMTIRDAAAGLVVTDMSTQTPASLVQKIVGNNVPFSNVTYRGAPVASGSFTGGTGIIGFEQGILLTSGDVRNVVGPNIDDGKTGVNGTAGDTSLNAIIPEGAATMDAAVLEFDFVPSTNTISFQYVFASDEYNEFANTQFNDVFGFFLNGTNVALLPGTTTAVSINTVNGGNPFGTDAKNPQFFRNNDLDDGGGSINTEMDGLTVVLNVQANVIPNQTNHIKLAIADVSDLVLDSAVFIRGGSFVDTPAAGQFQLSAANYNITEGNAGTSTQTVTVNRVGGTSGPVTLNYALTNGSATGGASCGAGIDYVNTPGTISFADGQVSQTFNVTICGDLLVEQNETINVTLSNPTNGATLGTPSTGTITIINDDFATPTPTPTATPTPTPTPTPTATPTPTPAPTPTAAGVTITGRVLGPDGRAIRGAKVTITDARGVSRSVSTNSFGFYMFDDIESGENYVIGASAKRYRFQSRTIQVSDSLSDVDFVGIE